jgi:hypothetical protein
MRPKYLSPGLDPANQGLAQLLRDHALRSTPLPAQRTSICRLRPSVRPTSLRPCQNRRESVVGCRIAVVEPQGHTNTSPQRASVDAPHRFCEGVRAKMSPDLPTHAGAAFILIDELGPAVSNRVRFVKQQHSPHPFSSSAVGTSQVSYMPGFVGRLTPGPPPFLPAESRCGSSFLLQPLGLAKSNSFSAAIILDEFNASSFQCSAQRGFVSKRYWDLPINNLRPTNSCHAHL